MTVELDAPNAVGRTIARIRARRGATSCEWREAAAWVLAVFREDCHETMDIIGLWPSSEPELRALQQVYP